MEKISWTDRVRYGEVLHRVKEEMNILLLLLLPMAQQPLVSQDLLIVDASRSHTF
jgi:hypothetical protein